jgi:hypothetical protein
MRKRMKKRPNREVRRLIHEGRVKLPAYLEAPASRERKVRKLEDQA